MRNLSRGPAPPRLPLFAQLQGEFVKLIRKRLTYANVMSSIAVFLVLGGGAAYAAKKIGSNEIKGNSITTGKIKKEAVTASKIKKNSVTTAKIANGAVTGAKINLGTVGTVPNATHAINADNANTVGGMTVSKIAYAANSGSGPQVVLNTQGLVLTAACPTTSPIVTVTTNVPVGVGVEFNTDASSSGNTVENISDDGTGGIFTTGDQLVTNTRRRGTFTFQTSQGHVVSGIFSSDVSPALRDNGGLGKSNCSFVATINAG
jgi:hypothetical protein